MDNLNDTLMDLFRIMFEISVGYEFIEENFDMNEVDKILYSNSEIHIKVALLQSLIDEYVITKKYGTCVLDKSRTN